jgi:thiol-disulfide isomerase/thioredoxin
MDLALVIIKNKTMRSLAIIFIALSLVFSSEASAQIRDAVSAQNHKPVEIFSKGDSIHISGKIKGLKADDEPFVYLIFYDAESSSLTKIKRQAIPVNERGEFSAKIVQAFEGDAELNYKDAFIKIYVKQGGHHQFEIVKDSLNRRTQHSGAFIAGGDLAALNNLFFHFQRALERSNFRDMAESDKSYINDKDYKDQRLTRMNLEIQFLESFIKNKSISDQKFINWQRNNLIYSAGREIAVYPFTGKRNKEISVDQLFTLLKGIPMDSPGAGHSSSYYHFLNTLAVDLQIILNLNPEYEEAIKKSGNNKIPVILDLVDKQFTGFAREFVYLNTYRSHNSNFSNRANPANVEWERIEKTIGNTYLRSLLQNFREDEGKFVPYNVFEKLNALQAPESIKKQVEEFLNKEKGSTLIIDFWADWCAPCLKQMPHYPKLIAAFEGKPVKFLFFSVSTDRESMLAIKEKHHINGTFINLDKEQTALMTNIFGLYGYPEHYIINPEGDVISNTLMPFYSEETLKSSVAIINRTIEGSVK